MTNQDRERIKIDRKNEMRTGEIAKMIGEGGIGADKYYDIKKRQTEHDEQEKDSKQE